VLLLLLHVVAAIGYNSDIVFITEDWRKRLQPLTGLYVDERLKI
jgi:hypothetical protein